MLFEVSTAIKMNSIPAIFRDLTPCTLLEINWLSCAFIASIFRVEEEAKQATSNLTQSWEKGSKVLRNTGAHLLLYNICIFRKLDEGKWEQSAKSLLSRKTGEVTWECIVWWLITSCMKPSDIPIWHENRRNYITRMFPVTASENKISQPYQTSSQ